MSQKELIGRIENMKTFSDKGQQRKSVTSKSILYEMLNLDIHSTGE